MTELRIEIPPGESLFERIVDYHAAVKQGHRSTFKQRCLSLLRQSGIVKDRCVSHVDMDRGTRVNPGEPMVRDVAPPEPESAAIQESCEGVSKRVQFRVAGRQREIEVTLDYSKFSHGLPSLVVRHFKGRSRPSSGEPTRARAGVQHAAGPRSGVAS